MAALVETRDLFAVYPSPTGGVAALQGLTLAVEEGEICVVLGPSGSGKSTLMHVLAGLERPSAGGVVVAGVDLGRASGRRLADYRSRTIGYADQRYWQALAGELTAEELVGLPLGLSSVPRRERQARARELLERVGLLDRAEARPGELSGGEQQRIAVCAALAHRPRLLLADEPTGELDATASREVYALLAELVAEQRTTSVVVSHDPASVDIADRVIHIRDGRVSEEHQGGEVTVVVGDGGWLRVPEDVLVLAGIGDRAVVALGDGVVELRPSAEGQRERAAGPTPFVAGVRGAVLEVRGVSRRYGAQTALADVAATFSPGEFSVVVGPSGSGKSTLLALLAGLDVPDEGDVLIDGISISRLDRVERAALRAQRIAFVGQGPALADFLTSCENVELGLAVRGIEDVEARVRAVEALAAVGLAEHAHRRVDSLSAGQHERVVLARAFAARPAVVLADEPTARLDAATTASVGGLLAELARVTETTVVCATHDPILIGLADHEVQLRRGEAVPSS